MPALISSIAGVSLFLLTLALSKLAPHASALLGIPIWAPWIAAAGLLALTAAAVTLFYRWRGPRLGVED